MNSIDWLKSLVVCLFPLETIAERTTEKKLEVILPRDMRKKRKKERKKKEKRMTIGKDKIWIWGEEKTKTP